MSNFGLVPPNTLLGNSGAVAALQTLAPGTLILVGTVKNVNANSANTDNAVAITLPSGVTLWRPNNIVIYNHGTTASLTTATYGLFTSTGGGGIPLIAAATALSGITATGVNALSNSINVAVAGAALDSTVTSLQFRIGTAQGAAATLDVWVFGYTLP